MKRYTLAQFQKDYPDDDSCLQKLFQLRYANLVCKCGNDQSEKPFTKVNNRKAYQCPNCGYQIHPCAGTVFEKTRKPLTVWFYCIYLHSTSKQGIAALEMQRAFKMCYTTALRLSHQIKKLMLNKNEMPLDGILEIDECYLGARNKWKHKSARAKHIAENHSSVETKVGAMGFLQRGGEVRVQIMTDIKTFKQRVKENVDKKSIVITDSHSGYKGLDIEYAKHEIINHIQDEFVKGEYSCQSIEGFWFHMRRTLRTHIHVDLKYLQLYIDQACFIYMNRERQDKMFDLILSRVA